MKSEQQHKISQNPIKISCFIPDKLKLKCCNFYCIDQNVIVYIPIRCLKPNYMLYKNGFKINTPQKNAFN